MYQFIGIVLLITLVIAAFYIIANIKTRMKLNLLSKHYGTCGIKIINKTDKEINDLYITVDKIEQKFIIPSIKPKQEFEFDIDLKEEFGERLMKIHYANEDGERVEESFNNSWKGNFKSDYYNSFELEVNKKNNDDGITFKMLSSNATTRLYGQSN